MIVEMQGETLISSIVKSPFSVVLTLPLCFFSPRLVAVSADSAASLRRQETSALGSVLSSAAGLSIWQCFNISLRIKSCCIS